MRKTMTKEVTSTKVQLAELVINEAGKPEAQEMPVETMLGNVSLERAQKELSKKHGKALTVLSVEPNTVTYEMSVEEFIQIASIKEDANEAEAELQEA